MSNSLTDFTPQRGARAFAAVAVIAFLATGCIDPDERRPGMRLAGEVAPFPNDWSFTNDHKEIALEVRTPYLLSHSVTIWCGVVNGELFVGARAPETKRWPGWVARDPDVRLKIDEAIYEGRLSPLDDPEKVAAVRSAYARKYELENPPPFGSPPVQYWRVERRAAS